MGYLRIPGIWRTISPSQAAAKLGVDTPLLQIKNKTCRWACYLARIKIPNHLDIRIMQVAMKIVSTIHCRTKFRLLRISFYWGESPGYQWNFILCSITSLSMRERQTDRDRERPSTEDLGTVEHSFFPGIPHPRLLLCILLPWMLPAKNSNYNS